MKYNNKYYKIIAQLLDENVDDKQHTDLYYTKRIAESYGETYSDLGNVNKYLREFAKDVGVELDNKHHTRLWYLKRIADQLYDGELEHNTENYYLRIISENIAPPTPVEVTDITLLKFTYNGEPVVNGEIFDGADSTIKFYTDENGELKNTPFPTYLVGYGVTCYYSLTVIIPNGNPQKSKYAIINFQKTDDKISKYKYDSTQSFTDITKPIKLLYTITDDNITVTEL